MINKTTKDINIQNSRNSLLLLSIVATSNTKTEIKNALGVSSYSGLKEEWSLLRCRNVQWTNVLDQSSSCHTIPLVHRVHAGPFWCDILSCTLIMICSPEFSLIYHPRPQSPHSPFAPSSAVICILGCHLHLLTWIHFKEKEIRSE